MLQSVDYNAFHVRIKDGGNMSSPNEQLAKDWWAEGGTPVHNDSHVTYFVDGRIAMFSMCLHFLRAYKYIYLANCGMTPEMELVRWPGYWGGPDGGAEQQR